MNHRILFMGVMLLVSAGLHAAGGDSDLDHADSNVFDQASVQRGAALFVNYCTGCHSAQYLRYQHIANDLGLSEDEVLGDLAFGEKELSDYLLAAIRDEDAEEWFGVVPPDLTLTARSRGPDWIYTFMRSFYLTDEGWNNRVLEHLSMPHVLWELQGVQRAITEQRETPTGELQSEVVSLELDEPGVLSPSEYDAAIRDLVAFMEYMAEPALLKRKRLGIWVFLFLSLFTLLSWLLYQEFWKDVKK